MIESRLSIAPEYSFVGEVNGVIEGVMSSQRTQKNASEVRSWEETTNNGTLEGTHTPDGENFYIVNLAISKKGTEHQLFDRLTSIALGTFIREQFHEVQLLSRIPQFSQWIEEQQVNFDIMSPEQQDDLARQYVKSTKKINGQERVYDGVLRRYVEFGVKPATVLRDSYNDPSSKNYEVLCTYANPLPERLQRSRRLSRLAGTALRIAANHPKLLNKLP